MGRLPQTNTTVSRYLRQQKRVVTRLANSTPYALSGTSVTAEGVTIVDRQFVAGTLGGARVELDATGLRQYAADGTTVLLDTADDATIRARGDSTAVGVDAQKAMTTGTVNTAVGAAAQKALTTGTENTAVGADTQFDLTDGDANTAIGYVAQAHLTTGNANTAVGYLAQGEPLGNYLNATKTASLQTSIGPMSGQSSPTQVDGITTIGYRAVAGAANATSIGREARADHAGSIALGYQALTTQVDQVMVGPRDVEITDTTKGLVLVSPDATRMRITAADGGGLLVNGAPIGGGGGTTLFADPNADRLVFWDDSAGAFAALTASTGLTLTGTDLTVRAATDALMGGVELATSAETITGTDDTRATTPAGVAAAIGASAASVPTATVLEFAGATAPSGFVMCDGAAVSRTTLSVLFGVIGTTFGVGDGSTTFNVPNRKGRVGVGRDAAQTEFDVLGEAGGAKTHTLATTEMPSHTHPVIYEVGNTGKSGFVWSGGPSGGVFGFNPDVTNVSTGLYPFSAGPTGGGGAHNNLQPYIAMNFIIKT